MHECGNLVRSSQLTKIRYFIVFINTTHISFLQYEYDKSLYHHDVSYYILLDLGCSYDILIHVWPIILPLSLAAVCHSARRYAHAASTGTWRCIDRIIMLRMITA